MYFVMKRSCVCLRVGSNTGDLWRKGNLVKARGKILSKKRRDSPRSIVVLVVVAAAARVMKTAEKKLSGALPSIFSKVTVVSVVKTAAEEITGYPAALHYIYLASPRCSSHLLHRCSQ